MHRFVPIINSPPPTASNTQSHIYVDIWVLTSQKSQFSATVERMNHEY